MEKGSEGKVAGPCFNISRYFSLLSFSFSLSLLLTTRRFSSKESIEHVMQVTIGACQCSIPEIPVIERYRRFSLPSKNRPDYVMRVITQSRLLIKIRHPDPRKNLGRLCGISEIHFIFSVSLANYERSLFSC